MRIFLVIVVAVASAWTLTACTSGGRGQYQAPPGQVQKMTGYNPASGKLKGAPAAPRAPAKGKLKIK